VIVLLSIEFTAIDSNHHILMIEDDRKETWSLTRKEGGGKRGDDKLLGSP
jgi:hypothetical protein